MGKFDAPGLLVSYCRNMTYPSSFAISGEIFRGTNPPSYLESATWLKSGAEKRTQGVPFLLGSRGGAKQVAEKLIARVPRGRRRSRAEVREESGRAICSERAGSHGTGCVPWAAADDKNPRHKPFASLKGRVRAVAAIYIWEWHDSRGLIGSLLI